MVLCEKREEEKEMMKRRRNKDKEVESERENKKKDLLAEANGLRGKNFSFLCRLQYLPRVRPRQAGGESQDIAPGVAIEASGDFVKGSGVGGE